MNILPVMTKWQDWKNMLVMDIKQIIHKETHEDRQTPQTQIYTRIYVIFEAMRESLPRLGYFGCNLNKAKEKFIERILRY